MITFRLCGIKIGLHFSFFAAVCLLLAMRENSWGLWCLTAALLHECGHLAAFFLIGAPPRELHFEYSGIRLVPQKNLLSRRQELWTVTGGAAVNLGIGTLLCLCGLVYHGGFHLALGLFNLLPLPGLDGGELLALLTERILTPYTCQTVLRVTAIAVAVPLSGWAVYLALTRQNLTLLLTVCYFLLLSLFGEQENPL